MKAATVAAWVRFIAAEHQTPIAPIPIPVAARTK